MLLHAGHAGAAVGASAGAGGIRPGGLLHDGANPRRHALREIGIDVVHREAVAGAEGAVRVFRPEEAVGAGHRDRPLEQVEVGHVAGAGATELGRLAERLGRRGGHVG